MKVDMSEMSAKLQYLKVSPKQCRNTFRNPGPNIIEFGLH